MKVFARFLLLAVCLLPPVSSRAIDLKQSKFTEVVNDVQVISVASKAASPAALNNIFKVPDILRTGANSRAELTADDDTITRVGADTIFSFDPKNRTIDLQQGSLLFHSPHGKGGGTIQTGSATASVLGTTIIVSTTHNGGFKVLVLEGRAAVKMPGITQHLNAGQMIFVLPGGGISPIVVFRLDTETLGSKLVGGFKNQLSSQNLINKAIAEQLKQIKSGRANDTGLLVGDSATASTIQAIVDEEGVASTSPSAAATAALGNNFNVTVPTLESDNIFLAAFNITIDPNNFLGGLGLPNPFYGFPGDNITINTPTVDLSPYSGLSPSFDIVALNNLTVAGSVTFTGFGASDQLYLAAGNQLTIASGATLEADCGKFWLGGFQPVTLDNDTLINNLGELDLLSSSDLTLQNNTSLQAIAGLLNVNSGGNLDIVNSSANALSAQFTAAGTLTLNNSGLTVNNNDSLNLSAGNAISIGNNSALIGGNESIDSSGGTITVNGSSAITAISGDITLNAISDLTVDTANVGANDETTISGATVTIGNSTITGGTGGTVSTGVNIRSTVAAITINNGSSITANSSYLKAEANTALTLDNATLANTANWGMNLSADNGVLSLNQATLNVDGDAILYGSGGVTIGDSTINPNPTDAVGIESGDAITINNNSIITANDTLDVSANSDLTIDTATLTGGSFVTTTLNGDSSVAIQNNSSVEGGIVDINSSGGTIDINGGSQITSDNGEITAEAFSDLNVGNATSQGALISASGISLTSDNGAISFSHRSFLNAVGDITANAQTGLTVDDTTLTSSGGNVNLTTATGNLNVQNSASITANTITLTAGDGILLDNVTLAGTTPPSGSLNATVTGASGSINVGVAGHGSVDLTGLASVKLAASTINLVNVAFAATAVLDLACSSGNANVGGIVPGDVNFINVTFGGTLITVANLTSFLAGAPGNVGFYIHHL